MFFKLAISLLCFLVSLGSACESKSGGVQNSVADPPSSEGVLDACALIEKSEIASVQGAEVQQVQPTSQKNGDLHISQCYYTATSADGSKNLSVFFQLIQLDSRSARQDALKEFWKERFGRESTEKRREEKEEREGGEEEEAINAPVRVSGIGDEAFWLGTSRGGALYVLKKEKVLRVTVGGADDAKAQIDKSKTLAKKALARLV
jgi:hypothetical protein